MPLSPNATNATRTQFAKLRHDLLNPLHVLTGATSALWETELTETQRAWVQMLRSTTARLVEIVTSMEDHAATSEAPPALADGRARLADLLSIAVARLAKPFTRQQLVAAIQQVSGRGPLRLLLVDDSPELVLLVRTFLKGFEWTLDVVENGERAVAQATTESYDLVLMDIDLPGLDGATAAHAIRAADLARGASPTPIIAMTAFDSPTPVTAEFRSPSQEPDFVTVDDPEIAPLIPEFLQNRRSEVELFRKALVAADYERLQTDAHKLKGTGRGYGFNVISRIAADLEVVASHRDATAVAALIDELEAYLARVRVSYA